jgi:hypothetical protein
MDPRKAKFHGLFANLVAVGFQDALHSAHLLDGLIKLLPVSIIVLSPRLMGHLWFVPPHAFRELAVMRFILAGLIKQCFLRLMSDDHVYGKREKSLSAV